MLLSNNGDLTNYVQLPSTGWISEVFAAICILNEEKYRVRVFGALDEKKLEELSKQGLDINGVRYGFEGNEFLNNNISPMKVELVKSNSSENSEEKENEKTPANRWVSVVCKGKIRAVSTVFQHLGVAVSRIIRVRYGDYTLTGLELGDTIEVPLKGELKKFR